jgi:hypothetical protein
MCERIGQPVKGGRSRIYTTGNGTTSGSCKYYPNDNMFLCSYFSFRYLNLSFQSLDSVFKFQCSIK